MTTSAPPPNYVFNSSANIVPNLHVPTYLYNANNYIPHPLQLSGHIPMGVSSLPARVPVAGVTGNAPGGIAYEAAHPHLYAGRNTTNV